MASKNNKALLEKYWRGETSAEEERLLRRQLDEFPGTFDPEEEQLFRQLDQFSNLSLGVEFGQEFMQTVTTQEARRIPIWKRLQSIAAVIILLVGLSAVIAIYFKPQPSPILAAEEDPEKAYQMATEALMLMSSKLNAASEYTAELDRFNDAAEVIKKETIQNQN